jgi:hypothetical protein
MARHPLVRHIAVILLAKALALTLLYVAFFAPSQRPALNDRSVAAAVLGSAQSERSAP